MATTTVSPAIAPSPPIHMKMDSPKDKDTDGKNLQEKEQTIDDLNIGCMYNFKYISYPEEAMKLYKLSLGLGVPKTSDSQRRKSL